MRNALNGNRRDLHMKKEKELKPKTIERLAWLVFAEKEIVNPKKFKFPGLGEKTRADVKCEDDGDNASSKLDCVHPNGDSPGQYKYSFAFIDNESSRRYTALDCNTRGHYSILDNDTQVRFGSHVHIFDKELQDTRIIEISDLPEVFTDTHDVATLLREYLDYIHIRNNKELDIEENLI
jgi:hypothetical protein